MGEEWLNPDLCELSATVRVERGPQYVELLCSDENLVNGVTAPHYRIGTRDAMGKFIRPDEIPDPARRQAVFRSIAQEKALGIYGVVRAGEKMTVVDWRERFAPKLWKVYQDQGNGFVKLSEHPNQDRALAEARKLLRG